MARVTREPKTMWEANAITAEATYGMYVNWEDKFYLCPFCGEPVYECDWSEDEFEDYICPICADNDGEE